MEYSIDRIVDGVALCIDENEKRKEIRTAEFPFKVYEGLVFLYESGTYSHILDVENARRSANAKRMHNLFGEK